MVENRLIAEFMGLPKVPCRIGTESGIITKGYKHPKVDVPVSTGGMQYKYSWDWLMPVVEKIEFLEEVNDDMSWRGLCTLEGTYNNVVEFIKEYNKTQCNNCGDMMLMLDEECPDCGRTN